MPCCPFLSKKHDEYYLTKNSDGNNAAVYRTVTVTYPVAKAEHNKSDPPEKKSVAPVTPPHSPKDVSRTEVLIKEPVIEEKLPEEDVHITEHKTDEQPASLPTEVVKDEEKPVAPSEPLEPQEPQEPRSAGRREGIPGRGINITEHKNEELTRVEKDKKTEQLIREALSGNTFLNRLVDDERMQLLIDVMYPEKVKANTYIIREGEQGSHMYVSAEGSYEVTVKDQVVDNYGVGKAFGELAILYNAKRSASIKAKTKGKLWVLDRVAFQKIMVVTGMKEQDNSIRFLKSVPILEQFDDSTLVKIADLLKKEFFPTGVEIVRQGDPGDKFYIIRAGTVSITKCAEGETTPKHIGNLNQGQYFGELALLQVDKRQATITAQAPGVECLTLDIESFKKYLGGVEELKNSSPDDYEVLPALRQPNKYSYITLDDLTLIGTLGVGGFGRVELAQYRKDRNVTFALKYLKKADIVQQQQQEHVFNEKNILMSCDSPFICKLYQTYRDSKYLYFLMEPCLGGDIWTYQQSLSRREFDEKTSRFIAACVVEAFDHLHSRSYIYRDLKPENLVLDTKGYVKIIDFGFAKKVRDGAKTWTFAGTPEYVAPEIIRNRGHNKAVDFWELGILIHELLCGRPPFRGSTQVKTYNLILKGIDLVDMPASISRSAQHLIRKLCRPVPAERIGCSKDGVAEIRKHKWFLGFSWQKLQNCEMPSPCVRAVKDSCDLANFEKYARDDDDPPVDDSGWDDNF